MGDFIKSAFGYFGAPGPGNKENDLVGQVVEVGTTQFRIRRVIAEGGYAVVLQGYEPTRGRSFAIKRLIAQDEEASQNVLNEIAVMKQLNGHPNMVKFFGGACVGKEKARHVGTEFLIVMEMCSGGSLTEFLGHPHSQVTLPSSIILQVLAQTCRAVQHMHKQAPPIIHRDLKVDNLLLADDFTIKLCDFGSATTKTYSPSVTWSALERGRAQEELEKVTTPMYRSPEMLDLYLNYPINEALDIWAFGCVFFYLVCGYHPFEDSAKLAILNANFNLPSCTSDFEPFHNLIRQMLLVDPTQRPNINSVYGELSDLATARNVPAFDPIIFNDDVRRRLKASRNKQDNPPPSAPPMATRPAPSPTSTTPPTAREPPAPPRRPNRPPAENTETNSGTAATASTVIGFLKGSAGHLFRNIRETSSKVMEAVTAAIPTDLDLKYITSRVAVMPYPAESGLEVFGSRVSMEEVQTYLDRHHPNSYAVYNLSPRAYRHADGRWFGGRVSWRPFEPHRSPSLWSLVELCQNARLWLAQKPENICIVHCTDGRQLSAVFVCTLLCFCRVFGDAASALRHFVAKRGPTHLTSSQLRYIDYVAKLVASPQILPHNHPIGLLSVVVAPIPTFNRLKTGCRPYVDVFQGGKKVFTSMIDYESLRTYELDDRRIEIILNGVSVFGDVTIAIYHARSLFVGKVGKAAAVKICQIQFHTGFVGQDTEKISFMKAELDHLHAANTFAAAGGGGSGGASATSMQSRYAESFHATIHLIVSPNERPRQGNTGLVFPWETLPAEADRQPGLCFTDSFEMRGVMSPESLEAVGNSGQLPNGESMPNPPETSFSRPLPSRRTDIGAPSSEPSPQVEHGSSRCTSPTPAAPTATLIAGLDWDQAPKTPTPVPGVEDDTGEFVEDSRTLRTPPAHLEEEEGDKEQNASGATPLDQSALPVEDLLGFSRGDSIATDAQSSTLLDDFFASPAPSHPPTGLNSSPSAAAAPAASWEDPWAAAPLATNLNPFDPFGTATEPPETTADAPQVPNFMHTSSSTSNLGDIRGCGGGGVVGESSVVQGSVSTSNLNPREGGGGNPFEEFDDFFEAAAAAAKGCSNTPTPSHRPQQPPSSSTNAPPPTSTANNLFYGFPNNSTSGHRQSPFAPSSPAHTQPSTRPHQTPPPTTQGARPRVSKNAFEDLLGDFGGGSVGGQTFGGGRPQAPKTLSEIRHQKLAQTEDPEALKVFDWLQGKDKNVRALLCTLGAVLWEGVRWEQISMADVMTVKQVKQQYRKAARAVHPDKWMNTEHVNMAKLILVELNDAMAEYERIEESNSGGAGFS